MDNYRNKSGYILLMILVLLTSCLNKQTGKNQGDLSDDYSGSESCRECHESFYTLWSTSHHGLAMQPITSDFIQNKVTFDDKAIFMEKAYYKAIKKDTSLFISELKNGVTTDYKALWALGGKNVYYFLTDYEGGRLQTLPLAYDVKKGWYNNPESAVRHFPNMEQGSIMDSALSWKDIQYTFNTSCYGCHVSQLENNFDIATNTYQTRWNEAGINCETCHGPSAEHVKVCREAGEGKVPEDLKIIMTSKFTPEQHNASCAPCHAKMRPITASYLAGDRFFDNYDLITLESLDFYPDGRDLGENYTMTGWHMNSCQQNSSLHCVTCHTSSGRYRYKSDDLTESNKGCTSCHEDNGTNYEQHTHHPVNVNSPKCIDCHMPMTRFGNMNRSDHSFRAPMPATTLRFKSPNACNICHTDKTAVWANQKVTLWKGDSYQKETLYIGSLVEDARKGEWKRVDEMLQVIETNKYGEVYTNSLIRLLTDCDNPKKWPVLLGALKFDSPLSRSSAAIGLSGYQNEEAKIALFNSAKDDFLLVRLAAAQSLAIFPQDSFNPEQLTIFGQVNAEYEKSLLSRPDDWSAYYNLGNHYQNIGKVPQALSAYETSMKIYPEAMMPLINSSFLYSVSGDQAKAEAILRKALTVEPLNEAANLNFGLLMAELNKMGEAENAFRTVLKVNEKNATAAYNLSIIVATKDLDESCVLSKKAMNASPDDPKYAYTYAYFLNQNKKQTEAIAQLEKTVKRFPDHLSSISLLGSLYLETGNKAKTIDLYTRSLKALDNNPQAKLQLQAEIQRINAL